MIFLKIACKRFLLSFEKKIQKCYKKNVIFGLIKVVFLQNTLFALLEIEYNKVEEKNW